MEGHRQPGFRFNMQFTKEQSTCIEIGPNIYTMLLAYERFADLEAITVKRVGHFLKPIIVFNQ
jgi:predicted lactoylglutathione lyase